MPTRTQELHAMHKPVQNYYHIATHEITCYIYICVIITIHRKHSLQQTHAKSLRPRECPGRGI